MTKTSTLAADFAFAKLEDKAHNGEFKNTAQLLRYVAALNADSTKKEFVAAAVEAGYNPATAAIQFAASRKLDCAQYGLCTDAAGRLIN